VGLHEGEKRGGGGGYDLIFRVSMGGSKNQKKKGAGPAIGIKDRREKRRDKEINPGTSHLLGSKEEINSGKPQTDKTTSCWARRKEGGNVPRRTSPAENDSPGGKLEHRNRGKKKGKLTRREQPTATQRERRVKWVKRHNRSICLNGEA